MDHNKNTYSPVIPAFATIVFRMLLILLTPMAWHLYQLSLGCLANVLIDKKNGWDGSLKFEGRLEAYFLYILTVQKGSSGTANREGTVIL